MKDLIRQIIREETKPLNPKIIPIVYEILNKITKDYEWYHLKREKKRIFGSNKTYDTYNLIDKDKRKWFMTINTDMQNAEHQYYPYGDTISKYIPMTVEQYNEIVAMWASDITNLEVKKSYEEHLGTETYDFFPDLLNDILEKGTLVKFDTNK